MFGCKPVTYSLFPKLGWAVSISKYDDTTSQPSAPSRVSSSSFRRDRRRPQRTGVCAGVAFR
jgi:hypothetical protein